MRPHQRCTSTPCEKARILRLVKAYTAPADDKQGGEERGEKLTLAATGSKSSVNTPRVSPVTVPMHLFFCSRSKILASLAPDPPAPMKRPLSDLLNCAAYSAHDSPWIALWCHVMLSTSLPVPRSHISSLGFHHGSSSNGSGCGDAHKSRRRRGSIQQLVMLERNGGATCPIACETHWSLGLQLPVSTVFS